MNDCNFENYEEIKNWFCKYANRKYDYCAVVTDRSLNLLEYIKEKFPDHADDLDRFISQSGLLLKAEEIADYYIENGVFPKMSLLDSLPVHGRSVDAFITLFFEQILSHLEKKGMNRKDVWNEFVSDFVISFYASEEGVILLPREYNLDRGEQLGESNFRFLATELASKISNADFANTSYVLSATIKPTALANIQKSNSNWVGLSLPQDEVDNHGSKKYVGLALHMGERHHAVLPCVSVYYQEEENEFIFVPNYFTDALDVNDALTIQEIILKYLKQENEQLADDLSKLLSHAKSTAKPLSMYSQQSSPVYGQLIHMLLAQITLRTFITDFLGPHFNVEYDVAKIAHNYGGDQLGISLEKLFDELSKIDWKPNVLDEIGEVISKSKPFPKVNTKDDELNLDVAKILKKEFEYMVYEMAIEHKEFAFRAEEIYLAGGRIPTQRLDVTGEKSVSDCLKEVWKKAGINGFKPMELLYLLAQLNKMVNDGDLSLKMRMRDQQIIPTIRNTELSLSILPKRIEKIYDDVFRLSQFYWYKEDFVERIDRHFANDLAPDDQKYRDDAVHFARLLKEHPSVMDTMLNWKKSLAPKQPVKKLIRKK